MAITVVIADSVVASRQEMVAQLQKDRGLNVLSEARDGREALEVARSVRPNILLLDGGVTGLDVVSVIEEMQTVSPDTGVIALLDAADFEMVRRLMRAGADDYIVKPASTDDILTAIRTVHQNKMKLRANAPQPGEAPDTRGQVITVYSPQGGSGKSMLTANLGVAMAGALNAKTIKGRVALLDLNLQFGDIDLMLNLAPENTIAGLSQKSQSGLDSELVDQYLTTHEDSGLRVLVAPSTPQYAESITVYTIEQTIEALRESYQYVLIDTPSQLQDTTLAALDAATHILLIATLDVLALHKTRTALEMLRQLYPPEKIRVILNRSNTEAGISLAQAEEALGIPLSGQIPSDGRVVVTSINEGKPFVLSASESQIARRVSDLANELIGRENPAALENSANNGSGSFFKRLFS